MAGTDPASPGATLSQAISIATADGSREVVVRQFIPHENCCQHLRDYFLLLAQYMDQAAKILEQDAGKALYSEPRVIADK
jgi:hypothetical protein